MSFIIKYASYPDVFSEVSMELGSPDQYQTITPIEKIVPAKSGEQEQDVHREYELKFQVVNNKANTITSHTMTREEISDYIDILKKLLAQTQ